ncbi:MAG: oligosaccharide flippase family protein [Saprospiraceae bacterium]
MDKGNNTIQAFWVALGSLSSFSLAIVSAAILSRYFDKVEYGTYKQIVYVYSTLLIVFSAGLPNVFSYFLPRYKLEQGKEIVDKLTKVLLSLGLGFGILLFISAGLIADVLKNPEIEKGLRYFSVIPIFLLPTLGIEGIFSTYKKTVFIAIYNTITRFLMLIFIVTPVIFYGGNYLFAIYGWIIVSIISFFLALYFKNIPFRGVEKQKSGLGIQEIFQYSVPIMFASIGGIIMRSSDQFYISRYFGTESFADYSNGFIQLPFVGMITGAAATVLMPIFSKIISEKSDINVLVETWESTLIKSATIIYPMVIFFILNAEAIIIILFTDLYLNSILFFQLAMAVNFFNIIIFSPLILALGKTKFYANIHFLFAGLTWLGGYLAVSFFDTPYHIAAISVLINILLIISVLKYSAGIMKIGITKLIPFKALAKLTLHGGVVFLATKFLIDLTPLYNFPLVSLSIIGLIGSLILLFTGPLLQLDYLSSIKPLLDKIRKI